MSRIYEIVFMDAVHYNVRQDNAVIKKAVYIAIGVKLDGTKEVIGMWIGGNESAKQLMIYFEGRISLSDID